MTRCKGTTGSGRPCHRDALLGTDYCRIKSHQRQVKRGLYGELLDLLRKHRKKTIVGFLSVVWLIFSRLDKPLQLISDLIQVKSHIVEPSLQQLEENVKQESKSEHQETRRLLTQVLKVNRDDLDKKYPYGYALFYAHTMKKEVTSFDDVANLKNINLDWNPAKVISFSNEYLVMSLPTITIDPQNIKISGSKMSLKRNDSIHFMNPFEMHRHESIGIIGEVLVDEKDYVIGLLGFAKRG